MKMLHSIALPGPLGTLLQPIIEQTNERTIHAVECLTRGPRGSKLEQAPPLFDYVRSRGLEKEMDRACVSAAIRATARQAYRISVNVHPTTLGDGGDFVGFLLDEARAVGVPATRLIVEIGEQSPAADQVAFNDAVCRLRDHGVAIAIDDVGFGHSNYKTILDCHPDYLKIDRYFVQGVSGDGARKAVVRSICDLAGFFDARVVAEGVELVEDYEVLLAMGITLFQGFLFSRPHVIEVADDMTDPRPARLRRQAIGRNMRSSTGLDNVTSPDSNRSSTP